MLPVSIAAREAYFSRLEGIRPDLLYSCSSFPVAVAAGLELSPARMPLSVNHRGKTPARDDICPLMELLAGAMETSGAQVVAGMHTCDMTRRFFQESHRFREPVFISSSSRPLQERRPKPSSRHRWKVL